MNDKPEYQTLRELHELFETSVLSGALPIHETPQLVQRVYWWGFWAGHESRESEITQALHERDIYYRAACEGGFGRKRIKTQGKSFNELEQLRKGLIS